MSDEGIHWRELDEDVSFESFLYDNPEPVGIAKLFKTCPALNVSAVSRRLGIKQSLMAAYINGTKTPSLERSKQIESEIHRIGQELCAIQL